MATLNIPVAGDRCGELRPTTPLYRNWPYCLCNLFIGHEGEHRYDRRDGVSFAWPKLDEDED
jgi:hypothetical protein